MAQSPAEDQRGFVAADHGASQSAGPEVGEPAKACGGRFWVLLDFLGFFFFFSFAQGFFSHSESLCYLVIGMEPHFLIFVYEIIAILMGMTLNLLIALSILTVLMNP
jgi:hypothetical protein